MAESLAVRRLCLAASIEGYYQGDERARRSAAPPQGYAGVKVAAVVPALIDGLLQHLDRDRDRALPIPLRLRVSMVPGIVTRVRAGYAGRPVAMATRLVDSRAVRDQLDAQRTALFALIVSDDLYQDVFKAGKREAGADGFRRDVVDMPDKEWREDAWVRGWDPGPPKPAGGRAAKALRDTVMPVLGAMPGSIADVLENPEVDTELGGAAHDAGDSHEEWITYTESAAEEHAYWADENGYLVEEVAAAPFKAAVTALCTDLQNGQDKAAYQEFSSEYRHSTSLAAFDRRLLGKGTSATCLSESMQAAAGTATLSLRRDDDHTETVDLVMGSDSGKWQVITMKVRR